MSIHEGTSLSQRIHSVMAAPTDRFDDLLERSGLNPLTDLRHGDWHGVSFAHLDIRGFDLSGCDLTGANFEGALITRAKFQHAIYDLTDLSKAADFDGFLAEEMSRASNAIRSVALSDNERDYPTQSLTLWIYQKLSTAAVALSPALINRRLKQGKEDPARINERRGMSGDVRPRGPLVWIHGASVGEVLAAAGLVEKLRALKIRILLTSSTVTSAAVVAKRFAPDVIHQYAPYDSPRYVTRFLEHWRPSLALFIESDLWPNLILSSAARRLPMVLVNGRMSERSFPRWRRLGGTISALLGRFDMCLAQSDADAERFAALGSRNVVITGNLKLDVPTPPADNAELERLMAVTRGRPVIVAASTHPGEEEILLEVHRELARYCSGLLTVIVPRHPVRGEAVANMIAASGLHVALRSQEDLPTATVDIYVADTIGELGLFYRLAPIVFMGGSLVEHGGQNPIEAIKLGASIVHGPHVFNFTDVYEALERAGGANRVDNKEDMVRQLVALLADPAARQGKVAAAERIVDDLGGALEKTIAAIHPYLRILTGKYD